MPRFISAIDKMKSNRYGIETILDYSFPKDNIAETAAAISRWLGSGFQWNYFIVKDLRVKP